MSAIINFLYAGLAPYDPETETEANGYNPDTWAAQMEDSALWNLVSSRISKDEAAALDRQYADDANKLFKQMQAFATGVENAQATYDKQALIKATPHNPRLAPLHVICLHIFRHSTKIFLAGRKANFASPACVKFMHSDEKSQLNFIELARDLTHRGCAVLPK